jgi:hypothetical protein
MWATFNNLFNIKKLPVFKTYKVYTIAQAKAFSTFKEAAIYAEALEIDAEIHRDNVKLAWKLPKYMGTWREHFSRST